MKTLTVEFSVTENCNLRCKYCYSIHKSKYMSIETANEFFTKINEKLKEFECENYRISYFGGEPLLNWKVIKETLPKFKEDKRCVGVVVISNGLLLNQDKVDFLKKYNCGFSWSFDGINSSENRPLPNPKFDSLTLYKEKSKFTLQLTNSCKVMLDPKSFNNLKENFEFFLSLGINHPDFSLVRDDIYTNNDIENYKKEIRRLGDFIIEKNLKGEYCTCGIFSLYILDTIIGLHFGKRNHGCFVGSNGCLYSTDGDFWDCERFRSAGIKPNPDELKKVVNNRYFEKCKKCELYEICNGGCTFSQMEKSDFRISEPLNSVCQLFKISYKEAYRVFDLAGEEYRKRLLEPLKDIITFQNNKISPILK